MNPLRWGRRHLQTCIGALGALSRQPLASLLTIAVIGVALALPAALQVLVQNGRAAAGNLDDIRDFSVYLKPGTALGIAQALGRELEAGDGVAAVTLIPADQALEELQQDAGLAGLALALEQNPLPHTLVVRPGDALNEAGIAALAADIGRRPTVDQVKLDGEWLSRLAALIEVMRRAVLLATLLLVGGVVIIIGNTIRLDIQNRQQEIEVMKLLGATDGFVRRPFLYLGFWYGLLGGLVALLLLLASLWSLSGPLNRLAGLYGSDLRLAGLSLRTAGTLLLGGLVAGCGGAFLAVGRHLKAIQPRV
jgi:cell division transport system permease protein